MKRRVWILLLAVVAGLLAFGIILRERALRQNSGAPDNGSEEVLPFVTTIVPAAREGRITIRGTGTVRPLREVTLVAEVSGRITWVADDFVTGGAFRQGEEILRIDSSDYVNSVTVALAEVAQRQLDFLQAEEESAIAREEWALLENRTGVPRTSDSTALGSLVFKEPQLNAAAAQLRSAQARLRDAEIRLSRTRITAPFNGRVRSMNADLGQFVGPGHTIASYYATDAVEIDVPVAGRDIMLLGDLLPLRTQPNRARVVVRYAGGDREWQGVVHRTEGALTETTRTLNAVVRVRAPYVTVDERPPLIVGTFVTAFLEGRHYDRYYTLPREALRDEDAVWVVEEGRLYTRPVEIIKEMGDSLYVSSGVTEEDLVVTSILDVVIDGMRVRTQTD